MPPKKSSGDSKKTEIKKKEKVIEDKTFGLKNKKGAKVQKFIVQVEKQVKSGGLHPLGAKPEDKKAKKEKELKEAKELASLFKPVIIQQKLDPNADPKSILCAYFKAGQCTKGDKCKFSHDLGIERKAEKRSVYADVRDGQEETMEDWDEDKLKEVVNQKHAAEKTNSTTIICKFFIEAVEKSLYGWFWECPNGGLKCMYRHALPAGYVLKKDKKTIDKKDELSLEDLIETERAALGVTQTKVTLDSFLAWKKRKIEDKKRTDAKNEEKKLKDFKSGKQFGISGRDMFSFNPDLVHDSNMEDGEATFDNYARDEEDDDTVEYKEIDFSALSVGLKDSDGTGTIALDDRFDRMRAPKAEPVKEPEASASAAPVDDATFDENLFLDEDLDGLDDELNDLDLN
ncbi:unnamed protein product [Diamesa serratosioi]